MLQNLLTAAVALTAFVWFHLTCCRFLDDADAMSLAGVLVIIFLASVTEVIPRTAAEDLLRRSPFPAGPTAWDVVLAATDPRSGFWGTRD